MQYDIYIAYLEIDTPNDSQDQKGKNVRESSMEELTESIVNNYNGYDVFYAYKCYKEQFDDKKNQYFFEKSKRITEIVRETVKIKRLNKGGTICQK